MNKDIQAGRELDALVAEKVMGWRWLMDNLHGEFRSCIWPPGLLENIKRRGWLPSTTNERYADWALRLPAYSTDIAAAWPVVERIKDKTIFVAGDPCYFQIHYDKDSAPPWSAGFFVYAEYEGTFTTEYVAEADTAPLAICRAALKAMEAQG